MDVFRKVISGLLLGLGLVCIYIADKNEELGLLVRQLPTAKISQLREGQYVELKGQILCDKPLELPFGSPKETCVFYSIEQRCIEASYPEGMIPQLCSVKKEVCPFVLKDATGKIAVNAEGARIEGVTLLDRYVNADHQSELLSEKDSSAETTQRNLSGHRALVKGLVVGKEIYVLGKVVADAKGKLSIAQSPGQPFIISPHKEEVIQQECDSIAFTLKIIGIALLFLSGYFFKGRVH